MLTHQRSAPTSSHSNWPTDVPGIVVVNNTVIFVFFHYVS